MPLSFQEPQLKKRVQTIEIMRFGEESAKIGEMFLATQSQSDPTMCQVYLGTIRFLVEETRSCGV